MKQSTFTLVSLAAVVVLLGLIGGLLATGIQSAREASRRVSCVCALKQFGLGLHSYADVWKTLPPARWSEERAEMELDVANPDPREAATRGPSWVLQIFPFSDQNSTF